MSHKQSTLILNKKVVTDDYVVTENDFSIICDASSNNITITLPEAIENNDQIFDVCVLNLLYQVKVNVIDDETIDGNLEFIFNGTPYTSILVQAINGNYYIIDSHLSYYVITLEGDIDDDEF